MTTLADARQFLVELISQLAHAADVPIALRSGAERVMVRPYPPPKLAEVA